LAGRFTRREPDGVNPIFSGSSTSRTASMLQLTGQFPLLPLFESPELLTKVQVMARAEFGSTKIQKMKKN
jgi:hypothetical protein